MCQGFSFIKNRFHMNYMKLGGYDGIPGKSQ